MSTPLQPTPEPANATPAPNISVAAPFDDRLTFPPFPESSKRTWKRKAKTEKAQRSNPTLGVRKEWWEQWMENEDLKITGPYNP